MNLRASCGTTDTTAAGVSSIAGLPAMRMIGLPDIHIEVKRVEDLRLRKALQQSSRDARAGEIPVVMHRRNYEPWRVSMYLQNFQRMYSDDIFDELKARIRGGIITLLLDTWICYYRDWQAGKEMGLDE